MAVARQAGFSRTTKYRSPVGNIKSTESSATLISEQSSSENPRINLSDTQILTHFLSGTTEAISARISREFVKDSEDGPGKIVHLTGIWKLAPLNQLFQCILRRTHVSVLLSYIWAGTSDCSSVWSRVEMSTAIASLTAL